MIRGEAELVRMRLAGHVPAIVFLSAWHATGRTYGMPTVYDSWQDETPHRAYLMLPRNVPPARVDLRCIVGLTVWIHEDPDVAAAMRDACIDARARRVVCVATTGRRDGEIIRVQQHWATDTAEAMSWQS